VSIYEPPEGYVYQRGPIDWWWGWSPVEDLKSQPDEEPTSPYDVPGPWHGRRQEALEAIVEHALGRIRADGRWEGDIIQGPYIAGLLSSDDGRAESEVMVALKQSNNGTVYVWSPQPLPHLED